MLQFLQSRVETMPSSISQRLLPTRRQQTLPLFSPFLAVSRDEFRGKREEISCSQANVQRITCKIKQREVKILLPLSPNHKVTSVWNRKVGKEQGEGKKKFLSTRLPACIGEFVHQELMPRSRLRVGA